MNDESFEETVLNELGDDKLQQIAGLLGPGADVDAAKTLVGDTASAFSDGLQEKAAGAPEDADEVRRAFAEVGDAAEGGDELQGVATFGGGLGGTLLGSSMMTGMLTHAALRGSGGVREQTWRPTRQCPEPGCPCRADDPLGTKSRELRSRWVGEHGMRRVAWRDLALVDHWRRYLDDPQSYLRRVLD